MKDARSLTKISNQKVVNNFYMSMPGNINLPRPLTNNNINLNTSTLSEQVVRNVVSQPPRVNLGIPSRIYLSQSQKSVNCPSEKGS